jgi:hypothetical protein
MSFPSKPGRLLLTREQAFEALRRSLELTGLQEKTVSSRQTNVRVALAKQLSVVDHFLSGSYRRHTMIGPLKSADIDIVVVLDDRYKEQGARAVLELVKRSLLDEYIKGTKISRNGQAVTITFSDFIVDVVPAFVRPWWTWDAGWDICDSGRNGWISTNPKKHVTISASANKAHGGDLVPRIKQLKAWNVTAGSPLHSFHLEALAWSIFGTSWWWNNGKRSDWASARYFFDRARGQLRHQLPDPAGTGSDVADYLQGAALDSAVSKVTSAFERCVRADKCAKDNDADGMHKAYSQVFGDYYPL